MPKTKSNKTKPITVTLTPEQLAIIEEVNEEFNFDNTSMSLRHIVNEYAKKQGKKK